MVYWNRAKGILKEVGESYIRDWHAAFDYRSHQTKPRTLLFVGLHAIIAFELLGSLRGGYV